jgi:hypothetical protein
MKMSTKIWESAQSFSRKRRTIIFAWKFGCAIFSKTLRMIMGKNTPISAFNPGLNLETKLIKIEQDNWKTIICDEAQFFRSDRHKYCLIAPRNLAKLNKIVRPKRGMYSYKNIKQIVPFDKKMCLARSVSKYSCISCNIIAYFEDCCSTWKTKQ